MLEVIWNTVIFPWEHRTIVSIIAIGIGFVVFLLRFIDAKPKPLLMGTLVSIGTFVILILWAPILILIGCALYWFHKESAYNRWIMSTDRQFERRKDEKPAPATLLPDYNDCTLSKCRYCPIGGHCDRKQTLVAP